MADACCSSVGELPRRPSGRPRRGGAPASCRRRPRGRTPRTIPQIPSAGWTVFQIPSTPGPFCPFDQDCAAEIIRKSLSILPPFPFPRHPRLPATRRPRVAPATASPVRRRCEARDGAHPQNGLLGGAAASFLHGSACSWLRRAVLAVSGGTAVAVSVHGGESWGAHS